MSRTNEHIPQLLNPGPRREYNVNIEENNNSEESFRQELFQGEEQEQEQEQGQGQEQEQEQEQDQEQGQEQEQDQDLFFAQQAPPTTKAATRADKRPESTPTNTWKYTTHVALNNWTIYAVQLNTVFCTTVHCILYYWTLHAIQL